MSLRSKCKFTVAITCLLFNRLIRRSSSNNVYDYMRLGTSIPINLNADFIVSPTFLESRVLIIFSS